MSFFKPINMIYNNLIRKDLFLYENFERQDMKIYHMSETTGFISGPSGSDGFINNYRKEIIKSIKDDDKVQDHQKYILNFLNDNTPYRGLLVYHGLGSGKTAASIFTSQGYNKEIVVMTPVSLINNYEDEIKTFGEKLYTTNNNWVWVPLIELNDNFNNFFMRLDKLSYDELLERYKTLNRIEEDDEFIVSIRKDKRALINYLLVNNYIPFFYKENLVKTKEILDQLIVFYNQNEVQDSDNIIKFKTKKLKEHLSNQDFRLGGFLKKIFNLDRTPNDQNPFTFNNLKSNTEILEQLSSDTNNLIEINTVEINTLLEGKKLKSLEYLMSNDLLTTIVKDDNVQLGIFMIQNGESNYEDNEYKEKIDIQVKKFYNLKYKFFGYNSGNALFLSHKGKGIFDKLIPKYQLKLIKDEVNEGDEDEDLDKFNIDKFIKFMEVLYKKYQNPFDNKVVIIDEIHNLTSMMLGSGYRMNYLYELLMRATNCNLIFLSGTPVINVPYQLAITFNLLRGLLKMYHIRIQNPTKGLSEYGDLLYKNPHIDRYNINVTDKTYDFSLLPTGFINNFNHNMKRNGVIKNIGVSKSEDEILDEILQIFNDGTKNFFEKNDYTISSIFPDFLNKDSQRNSFIDIKNNQVKKQNQDKFNEIYIDSDNMTIRDNLILDMQKRIIGLVSHFNEVSATDSKIFPSVFLNNELITHETDLELSCEKRGLDKSGSNDELYQRLLNFGMKIKGSKPDDEIYMSELQFLDYLEKRNIEYEKEEKERKKQMMQNWITGNADTFSFFKVLTRQCGNFTFPTVDRENNAIKKILRSEFRKDNNLKKELLFLMDRICNNDDEKQELLAQLCAKINSTDSIIFKNFYQEIINTISIEEDIDFEKRFNCKRNMDVLEKDIDLFCKSTSDFNDIEEYFDKESKNYEDNIIRLIDTLDNDHLNFNINPEFQFNLLELSPKFYKILNNIYESKGLVFGYSQFRKVEGLTLFERVLKINGFKNYDYDGEISVKDTVRYYTQMRKNPATEELMSKIEADKNDITDWNQWDVVENEKCWNTGKIEEVLEDGTYKVLPIKSDYWYNNPELRQKSWESLSHNEKKYLTINNFSADTWSDIELESELIIEKTNIYQCKYAEWSGDTSSEEKAKILKLYTDESNKYGKNCLILLTTQSGSEGISLKHVRQVHIFEPYWNEIRTKQVIGRARRLNSHILLPENERNVEVFKYQIKFNTSLNVETFDETVANILQRDYYGVHFKNSLIYKTVISKDEFLTSDQTLNEISINKTKLLQGFLDLIKKTSIDCEFNKEKNELSDPTTYKNINCLNNLAYRDDRITNHTYDLEITYDDKTFITEDKFIIMRAEINNLFIMIKYNAEYQDINEAIEKENELDAYNFYKYYSLGEFKDKISSEQVIGKLFLTPDGTLKMKFLQGENINQSKYKYLQQIIKKKYPNFPVTNTIQNRKMIVGINKEYNESIAESQSTEVQEAITDESVADEPEADIPTDQTSESASKIVVNQKKRALNLLRKKKEKKPDQEFQVTTIETDKIDLIHKITNDLQKITPDVDKLIDLLNALLKINNEFPNIESDSAEEILEKQNINSRVIERYHIEILTSNDQITKIKNDRKLTTQLIELIKGLVNNIVFLLKIANEIYTQFKVVNDSVQNIEFGTKLNELNLLYEFLNGTIINLKSHIPS